MPFHRCAPASQVTEGEALRMVVDGRAVLLTRVGADVHAISDVCPHNGASLAEGVVRDGCVTCPSHLWRFSLVDGMKQGSAQVRVAVYPTRESPDGWVEVDVPPAPAPRSLRETLLAQARGEPVDQG